jgi:TolA-binding protein
MTPFDGHPEALLEQQMRGQLDAAGRSELGEHLVECPACTLHLSARAWFAPELEDRAGDAERNLTAIERAIRVAGERRPMAARLRRGSWSMKAALAALVVGGIAAGAYYAGERTRSREVPSTSPLPSLVPVVAASPPATLTRAAESARNETVEQNPPNVAVKAPATPKAARAPERSAGSVVPKVSGPEPTLAPAAEELFAHANQARRGGRDQEAMALYRELQRAYPDSREAELSKATLARLLLDHGQAEQALSGFDAYLGSGRTGAMSEDALVGRAGALMRLSRRNEERATWQELLRRYPTSIHASRARVRLGELR